MPDGDSFAGGTYPCPPEEKLKRVKGYAVVTYEFDDEFPITYSDEEIYDYIENNINDYKETYVSIEDITIEEE